MVEFTGVAYSDMWSGERCEVDGLDSMVVKIPLCVKEPDGIASYQSAQRIAHNTQLPNDTTVVSKELDVDFDFSCHSLASRLYTVVGQISTVALRRQNMELVIPIALAQRFTGVIKVPRMAVQPVIFLRLAYEEKQDLLQACS